MRGCCTVSGSITSVKVNCTVHAQRVCAACGDTQVSSCFLIGAIRKNKAPNLQTNLLILIRGEGDWNRREVMKIILSRFNLSTGFNLSEVTRHELCSQDSCWILYLQAKVNNLELSCLSYCFSNTFSIYSNTKTVNMCRKSCEGNFFVYIGDKERGDQ